MSPDIQPTGLQKFFGNARKVTGFLSNPLQTVFPNSNAASIGDDIKNVGTAVASPRSLGIASNLGYVTQIPSWLGTAGLVNTGVNTADQLLEYGQKGFGKTLDDMKNTLTTRSFENPVLNTGSHVLQAASRPLVSVPLGIREGARAIAPALRYTPPTTRTPVMKGGQTLMSMHNKQAAFFNGMLKAAAEANINAHGDSGLVESSVISNSLLTPEQKRYLHNMIMRRLHEYKPVVNKAIVKAKKKYPGYVMSPGHGESLLPSALTKEFKRKYRNSNILGTLVDGVGETGSKKPGGFHILTSDDSEATTHLHKEIAARVKEYNDRSFLSKLVHFKPNEEKLKGKLLPGMLEKYPSDQSMYLFSVPGGAINEIKNAWKDGQRTPKFHVVK